MKTLYITHLKNTSVPLNRFGKRILFLVILLITVGLYAQKQTVTGTVYDSSGNALSGVEIKNKNQSAVSDQYGHFRIEASDGEVITFNYGNLDSQEITVTPNMAAVDIRFATTETEKVTDIEAVNIIAVGYGKVKKKDLTGSVSSIGEKDLAKGVINSTEQALQGRVAGLTIVQGTGDPSSGSSIRLRGGTSLTASNNPLIVVDGIPGVDINIVPSTDIQSIDVLKDASATAIYGSRGANGVIIITTKSGSKKISVNYNNYVAVAYAAKNLDMLSGNQWRDYVRKNNIAGAVDYGANTDWQKELQQISFSQQHELSLSSASEYNGLRASLIYFDNPGIIKTTGLTRLNANINAYQFALDKKLRFDMGVLANIDEWNPLDYRIFERAFNLNPTIPVYTASGDYSYVGGTLYENPVEIMNNRTSDSKRRRMMGYFKTEADILPGLKAVANLSMEYNLYNGNNYKPSYAVMEGLTEKGWAQKTYSEYVNSQLETYLNYTKTFGEHTFNAMAGYSFLQNDYEGFGAQRSGFVTDFFGYNNLGAGYNYRIGDVYSYKGKSNLVSFYGRLNYNYGGRYLLTGTIRRDGSSRFGADNKWGVFPSVSAAWRISEEKFMQPLSGWLRDFKIRAGYGVTGNQDGIGEYKSLSILGVGNDTYYDPTTGSWSQAYAPIQNPNPNLKWEETKQTNIGVDFNLFNRISASVDYYDKKTDDLLYTYQVPQPPYLVGTMLANVGTMRNKGVEVTLNADLVKNNKFSWNTTLTFAHNKQKIEKLSNQIYETDIIYSGSLHGLSGMSNMYSQIIAEGYAVGTFWGKKFLGFDETGNFKLSEEDQEIGNVQPDYTVGITMNFNYKNIDLSISGYGMFGQDVLNATNMMLYTNNRLPAYNIPDDYLNSGINAPPTFSSYWIEDASFFRLQNVTLGYTVPLKGMLTSLRIYAMGQNLAVWTKYKGIDPEIDNTGLSAPGIDKFNNYPRPRTFSVGMNLTLSK